MCPTLYIVIITLLATSFLLHIGITDKNLHWQPVTLIDNLLIKSERCFVLIN